MATAQGHLGFDMRKQGQDSYVVESRWQSIPDWEAFNLSKPARRHHLPTVRSCGRARTGARVNALKGAAHALRLSRAMRCVRRTPA